MIAHIVLAILIGIGSTAFAAFFLSLLVTIGFRVATKRLTDAQIFQFFYRLFRDRITGRLLVITDRRGHCYAVSLQEVYAALRHCAVAPDDSAVSLQEVYAALRHCAVAPDDSHLPDHDSAPDTVRSRTDWN